MGVIMGDPVGEGLIISLAQPGGNITGLSGTPRETAGRRLELLKEALPEVTRVAVLVNPANNPSSSRQMQETQVAAQALGIQLHLLELGSPEEIEGALSALARAGAETLFVLTDPLMFERHVRAITTMALQSRLPAMYPWRMYSEAGGLMSYSVSATDVYRRAAFYVDQILKGAKVADLPVEQPMKFERVVNLNAAKELGFTIPPPLLFQADEIIR